MNSTLGLYLLYNPADPLGGASRFGPTALVGGGLWLLLPVLPWFGGVNDVFPVWALLLVGNGVGVFLLAANCWLVVANLTIRRQLLRKLVVTLV